MTRFRSFTVAAVVAGLLAGGAAFAQGPGLRGGRGPGGFGAGGGLPLRALDLTDAQQEQVRNLTQQYRTQNQDTAQRLRAAQETQRKAVETLPVDEELIGRRPASSPRLRPRLRCSGRGCRRRSSDSSRRSSRQKRRSCRPSAQRARSSVGSGSAGSSSASRLPAPDRRVPFVDPGGNAASRRTDAAYARVSSRR
jgi:hypothetical protein